MISQDEEPRATGGLRSEQGAERGPIRRWRRLARQLRAETLAVYLALRDRRTPWYVRLLAAAVVAYAFSPIDLVPDFVPVLGQLDDLILVPLGIALVVRLLPTDVLNQARAEAEAMTGGGPAPWFFAGVVVATWLIAAVVVVLLLRAFGG